MNKRYHDTFSQNMSSEKMLRNTTVMKALSRSNLLLKNKDRNSVNNNVALPYTFIHSTPLKREQITDLDILTQATHEDVTPTEDGIRALDESVGSDDTVNLDDLSEPELVIAKIYELAPDVKMSPTLNSVVKSDMDKLEHYEVEVTEAEIENGRNENSSEKEAVWKSLEVLDEEAEYEFIRSLERSKQVFQPEFSIPGKLISLFEASIVEKYLSASNLLEEIEADLPSNYSLARPLNHTFHSLASYRTVTRLARMEKNLTFPNDLDNKDHTEVYRGTSKRIDRLETEAMVQQANIKQAQKALLLSRTKKTMEVENLESEKALLLANLRFSAVCQEIEKLKLLGDVVEKENFGQITIWGVQCAIDSSSENTSEVFICTATDRENVQVSSTMYKLNGKLCFDEPMKFQNLNKDFVIYIEMFRRIVKETKTPVKANIIKKLKELTGNNFHKKLNISSSLYHGFECIACAQLCLEHIAKRENEKCYLNFTEFPKPPVTGDVITLRLKTHFNTQTQKSGFLNVFRFTWHRRWFSLSGHFLNSWLYPDDQENEKPPIDSIHLSACKKLIEPADIEKCIRPHSFVLIEGSDNEETLFSAESHKDMLQWLKHLNLIIQHFQIWKPNV